MRFDGHVKKFQVPTRNGLATVRQLKILQHRADRLGKDPYACPEDIGFLLGAVATLQWMLKQQNRIEP